MHPKHILTILLSSFHDLTVSGFQPTGSFVAYYRLRGGGYGIMAGLAFNYNRCRAILDALTEAQVIDQIPQDFSAASYGQINRYFAPSAIGVGLGRVWAPADNHFGVITLHSVSSQSRTMIAAAAYALAEAYGLPNSAVYSSAPNTKREAKSDEWELLDDVQVIMKDASILLTDEQARALLHHAVELDSQHANTTKSGSLTKREQYCATYNGASYKCIDWSHNVESGSELCYYDCLSGRAEDCGF